MANSTPKTHTYRPNTGKWAIISSMFAIIGLMMDIILSAYGSWHFERFDTINTDDELALDAWLAQTERLSSVSEWLGYAPMMLFVISAIFVGKWIYNSHHNARALGVENISYSPLLAVGSFAIPLANLFMPFIAMKDMVNGSFEKADKPTFHGVILLWWVCFVVGKFTGRYYYRQANTLDAQFTDMADFGVLAEYCERLAGILNMLIISSVLSVISAVALIVIIRRTSTLHAQMYQTHHINT